MSAGLGARNLKPRCQQDCVPSTGFEENLFFVYSICWWLQEFLNLQPDGSNLIAFS